MILYSENTLKHKVPEGHPENPKRLKIILSSILDSYQIVHFSELANLNEILEVHSKEYVDKVINTRGYLDPDTYISDGTLVAALTSFKMAKYSFLLAKDEKDLVFALTRPPGHHAGKNGKANTSTNGFCIFNNIAGAIKLAKNYLKKVVVIDFDVHHGNGTQDIFLDDDNVIHIDLHQSYLYPFTGDNCYRTKINIPLPPYSKNDEYLYAWDNVVLPILDKIKPKIILISAGFDGYKNDGLSNTYLDEKFYYYIGNTLSNYSIAAVLEGGYSLGLKYGVRAFLDGYYGKSIKLNYKVPEDIKIKIDNIQNYILNLFSKSSI
ncbi:histone deacetylase family protein [Methanocaldococcus indicus]|uniref:histone deacetylase family protein n=1 Tax=Methanocaldococcus indicus TaxID=213231 RepID=UPI003C6D2F9D